ncbi:MAG: hypothetical protein ABS85_05345 [Sphingobacteriales bacterium SCN 48-20]|nr:MAG: hypothetical protein ABS85_05345 [Sphingobacteriales bacterium SCN 48-20]OJW41255.1 MAG: hypothetical protein BGO56_07325 [Sphingobacteriales bacterium 48-107]
MAVIFSRQYSKNVEMWKCENVKMSSEGYRYRESVGFDHQSFSTFFTFAHLHILNKGTSGFEIFYLPSHSIMLSLTL